MRKISMMVGALVLLTSAGLCSAQSTLTYTGADLTGGAGTMTVLCSNGATELWSLGVVRTATSVLFLNFDDRTDTGSFMYAQTSANATGMMAAHVAGTGTVFQELYKGADAYRFSMTETHQVSGVTDYDIVTTYQINPSNASQMSIQATRVFTNRSAAGILPPVQVMTCVSQIGVGPYNGRNVDATTNPNGGCRIAYAYAADQTRKYLLGDLTTPALYSLKDNLHRTVVTATINSILETWAVNPYFSAAGMIWGEAVVLDTPATQALGMKAGRKIRLDSDIKAYYPGSSQNGSFGDLAAGLNGATYQDGIFINIRPREWYGNVRTDMNVPIAAGTSTSKTFTLSVNIGYGVPGVYDAAQSTVTAGTPILNNGAQESTIIISVKDAFGDPVANVPAGSILVSASGSGNTITQPAAATDANGQTVAYLKSTVAGDKTITVTVNGVAIAAQPVVAVTDKPVMLLYSGKNLITDVVPDVTTRQVMTITCYDVVQSKNLWSVNVDRWNAPAQGQDAQVRIQNMTDLTNAAGTFTLFQNRVLGAHRPVADGLDPASYTELHKGADYFEFSVTELRKSAEDVLLATIVTTYRINPASDEGTRITAVRTTTNVSDAAYVPGEIGASLNLADGGLNPRLSTGNLTQYGDPGSTSERLHVEMSGTTFVGDGIWRLTDNACQTDATVMDPNYPPAKDNPAFDATVPMWLQGVVMDTAASARVHATVGRTVRLGCDISGFSPAALGNIAFDPRADYLDGIWASIHTIDWLGGSRADHLAGIAPGLSETRTFTLDINILGSSGGAPSGPPEISLALQFPWVYQNTPVATLDRHKSLLTVTIVNDPAGPQAYTTTVVESAPVGKVICQPTADPLVWSILGCRRNAAAQYANTGMATLTVTVTGVTSGLSDSDTIQIKVRPLGDITDDGFADATDKLQINRRLNSVATPYTIREMDLTGDGFADATDKLQINRMLNSIAVP